MAIDTRGVMDKERVKRELQERHGYQSSGEQTAMVNIMLDAIELSREQDIKITLDQQAQIMVGSLVVCPHCNGVGCTGCDASGMVRVVSNTPSA